MNTSPLVPIAQAAEVLGIKVQTAYKLVKKGEFPLPIVKVGSLIKVPREQLDHFVRTGHPLPE